MTKQEKDKMKEKIKSQLESLLKEGQEPVNNIKDFYEYKLKVDKFLDSAFTEFEQAVREEIYKRGYADGKNEQPYGINKDVSIN